MGDVVIFESSLWRDAADDVTGEVRNERHALSGLPLQGMHYTKVYHPTGNVLGKLMDWKDYGAPGPDGAFGTADDVLTYHAELEYFSAATGTDMVIRAYDFETGVVISAYREVTFVNAFGATKWVSYVDSGSDALWRTDDDPVASYREWEYDGEDRLVLLTAYGAAGDDMTWSRATT